MARKAKIDAKARTKGEIRRLNALRRSVGEDLAETTFRGWLAGKPESIVARSVDGNAAAIAAAVECASGPWGTGGPPRW